MTRLSHSKTLATSRLLLLCGLLSSIAAENLPSLEAWKRFESRQLQSSSLLRSYTFGPVTKENEAIGNSAAEAAEMTFVTASPGKSFQVVEGRWANQKAVRLDAGCFAAKPFEVKEGFTASAWVKVEGYGSMRGNNGVTSGTLLSVGIGYWDGWRLTITYPDRRLGMEIGRPAPDNSIAVRSAERLPEGQWFHVCTTWDRERMTVWVNGQPVAAGEYSGPYYPPKADGMFKLGYAGFGWGSAVLIADFVSVHNRALKAEEILAEVFYEHGLSPEEREALASAHAGLFSGDLESAERTYQQLSSTTAADALREAAQLQLGKVALKRGDIPAATKLLIPLLESRQLHGSFAAAAMDLLATIAQHGDGAALPAGVLDKLLKQPGLSDANRDQAKLNIARSHRNSGDFAQAERMYEELLAAPALDNPLQLAVRFELAHTYREERAFDKATALYQEIREDHRLTPAARALAGKCLATLRVAQGRVDQAILLLQELAEATDSPPQFRQEAAQSLRKLTGKALASGEKDESHLRSALASPALTVYVSPDGSDESAGTIEQPFATIDRARIEVRKLPRERPVCVALRKGKYLLKHGLQWTAEDSGKPDAPILYRAFENEQVVISGGLTIKGFQRITDEDTLQRLPEEARESVLFADLKRQGITDFGELKPHGLGTMASPAAGLFIDGKFMPQAQWPNAEFSQTGKVVSSDENGAVVEFKNERLLRWTRASQAQLRGYWYWDWADRTLAIGAVSPDRMQLQITQPLGNYGIRDNRRFQIINLLEEIDRPGEWFLDRQTGLLYLFPPSGLDDIDLAEFSLLSEPLLRLSDVSDVVFQNLVIESGRSDGVVINSGSRVLLTGCHIRQLGGTGIIINGGSRHGVFGCDIYAAGRGGVRASGGDRKSLKPGGHFVENCHIHHLSHLDRTYTPAVRLDGVGNRIVHNRMHHIPSSAMRIEGNDHLIEMNEIHHCVFESDDQGGLDMWFNPTYRGNIIRHNFWHHIGSGGEMLGQAGVRLDDAISGVLVYGNVFYRCSNARFGALQIHGGKGNIVDSNFFIDCEYAVTFSGWGKERWKKFIESDRVKQAMQDVDADGELYRTRYPKLAEIEEEPDRNSLWRNVIVDCGKFLERARVPQDLLDNFTTSGDPGFVSRATLDFSLRDDSKLYERTGIAPIPFNLIGLYPHALRTTLKSDERSEGKADAGSVIR